MAFVRGSNPIWSYVDLQGKQFDDTFYMFVLQNVLPYLPEVVYHEPDGVPWTNPIQFLANGTLPNDIYFDPGSDANPKVYRLEFRRGPTQNDPLIYEVNNYIPGQEGGGTPSDIGFTTDNQITNPQFSLINFTSPLNLSSASNLNIEIAPGWTLELNTSGPLGTAVVTQVPLNNSVETPSNAPYALRLTLASWSSVKLKQRFVQNGVLWANTVVSGAVTASVQGLPQNISSVLVDSMGAPLVTIIDNKQVNSSFNEFTGHATLPASSNTDLPPAAYIEYQIIIPPNIDIFLTSFQLVSGDLELEYPFEQDTVERQIDHSFHYYYPLLAAKPIPSWLTGWDFSMNPAQRGSSISLGTIGANKSAYLWDQTIGFQSTNNSVAASRSTLGNLLLTMTGTTRFALIQYLDLAKARQLLINNMSVLARLTCASPIPLTISLWYTTSSIPIVAPGTNDSLVTSLDATGFPTVSGNWTEIKRSNLQHASFTAPLGLTSSTKGMIGFSGWNALDTVTAGTATAFAIVIGSGSVTNVAVEFAALSLVPGDVPTLPAPQTKDEVLRECEFYCEKTYNDGVNPGTANDLGAIYMLQSSFWTPNTAFTYPSPFTVTYKVEKRTTPLVYFYNMAGTPDSVQSELIYNFGGLQNSRIPVPVTGNWAAIIGTKSANYTPASIVSLQSQATTPSAIANSAGIRFHNFIDARLGIV